MTGCLQTSFRNVLLLLSHFSQLYISVFFSWLLSLAWEKTIQRETCYTKADVLIKIPRVTQYVGRTEGRGVW